MQTRMVFLLLVLLVLACGVPNVHAQVSPEFSTFLGGTGNDSAQAVAVAPDGCIWVCGYTLSTNFPVVNPIQAQRQGSQDAFVSKFSPDGGTLLFSTYLGGSGGASLAMGITVDDDGNAYVCGYTDAANFPTLNAFQPTLNGFWTDMFICKLDASGTLIYSSYLGGSMFDYSYDIAVDTSGCAYVVGKAWSTDFPTTVNAFQTTNANSSGYNFTVTKVAADGASLVYSTYLGGTSAGHDYPRVAVTPEGIAYFGGATTSTDYPVTPNAYQPVHAGPSPSSWDGVVSVLSADGSSLTYSTFLGGSEDLDQLTDIAIGADGAITVVGLTQSDNFPLVNAIQSTLVGQPDYFVTRFTPAGDALEFSTYLGGWDWDYGQGVAVGEDGSVVVIGITVSPNYPVSKAFQSTRPGGYDCGISKLSPDGTTFEYSTYLGGSGDDFGYRVVLDADGNAIVVGRTASSDFPTTNAFQAARGGGEDGFVARLKLIKADQTINFPAIGNKSETNVVGLSATATSGLDVSFAVGSGPATITGGTNLSFTGTGTVSIVASQAGDADWNAAPNVTHTFNVLPDGTEYCASSSASSAWEYIDRVRFNTIDNPSGASLYSDFTAIFTELERGNAYVITVNNADPWSGDKCAVWVDWNQNFSFDDPGEMTELLTQDYAVFTNAITVPADALPGDTRMRIVLKDSGAHNPCGASGWGETEDYTVWLPGKLNQTINFPAIGDQVTTDVVGLAATASSGLDVSFAVVPGSPATLAGGTNLSFTGTGTVSIVASQAGDETYNPAPNVTNTFNVTKATAGVTLNNLNQVYNGSPRVVTATTVPVGLTVDITYDGSATAPTDAGTYAVTGTVNDIMYAGEATGILTVSKAGQTINFPGIPDQHRTNVFHLAATASSGLPVTFAVQSGPAVLTEGTNLSFTGSGEVVIRASQAGDANWNPAPDVLNTFRVVESGMQWTDYDGDGMSDLAVYGAATGNWYIRTLSGTVLVWQQGWGYPSAWPIPGDYDGDGMADIAVYDDLTGSWHIRKVSGEILASHLGWGYPGTVAVPGDYDGDGVSDLAVYEDATGFWHIRSMGGDVLALYLRWGYPGAMPVPGDYSGDGVSDLAVYEDATGFWHIRSMGGDVLAWYLGWGYPGAVAVPGDYDGDGMADLAVYDERTGRWDIRTIGGEVLAWNVRWGYPGTVAVPGDYNGDGIADLAVYDAVGGRWYIRTITGEVLAWGIRWGSTVLQPVGSGP